MCMGLPMQVISTCGGEAVCERRGERFQVNTMLVGEPPAGAWLLVFLDSAREVISAKRAAQIEQALQAVEAVMHGHKNTQDIDRLFADLTDREPELPEFLRK